MRSKATIKKLTADDFKLLKALCSIYGNYFMVEVFKIH